MKRHIGWLLGGMMMLLLTACGGGEEATEVEDTPDGPPTLTIYVYAPERPMMTRAGEIDPTGDENTLKSLQIWVFETGTDNLVGYLQPSNMPSADGTVYQMNVSESFANATSDTRPKVDVYVVANGAATGLTLSNASTRTLLEDARIAADYFGLNTPVTDITANGLPMTGVLRNQTVVGDNPVLRIGNYSSMAKVQLVRAVSKIRFAFGKAPGPTLTIKGITIKGNSFPTEEFLFLAEGTNAYHVGTTIIDADKQLLQADIVVDKQYECDNPTKYLYKDTYTAQQYEDLITKGVTGIGANTDNRPELIASGPYYLRETNQQVKGTLTYQVEGNANAQTMDFNMKPTSTFHRNHSWIVYAYYEGLSGMQIITVDVLPWTIISASHEVYNW